MKKRHRRSTGCAAYATQEAKLTQNMDLRIKRTRKLVRDALVELIDERGFDAITVQDIAERAMINRATFYRHFTDKYELLERCMDDVWDELVARLDPPLRDPRRVKLKPTPRSLVQFFEHVGENTNFYRTMLGKWQVDPFTERLRHFLTELFIERFNAVLPAHHASPLPPSLVIAANVAMCIGVIRWWVENHQPCSAADIAHHYLVMSGFGFYRAVGVETPNWDASER
jgi:AcrR family transcriptional regulator